MTAPHQPKCPYICVMKESHRFTSTGRLIGDALDHWVGHQSRFWILAGPVAVVLAALPFVGPLSVNLFAKIGLNPPPNLVWAGIHVLFTALVLYQWFKYALYDDWSQRRRQLWKQQQIPWRAFVSGGFIVFWVLQLLLSYIALSLWGELVRSRLPSGEAIMQGAPVTTWLLDVPIVYIKEIALALIFGGFLLFLPACAVGIPWGPLRAFREAAGIRNQLIAISLFLTFLLVVSEKVLEVSGNLILSQPYMAQMSEGTMLKFHFVRGLLNRFMELLTFYVLAHAVSQLFLTKTRWTPTPDTDTQPGDLASKAHG